MRDALLRSFTVPRTWLTAGACGSQLRSRLGHTSPASIPTTLPFSLPSQGLLEKLKERRVQHVSKGDWQVIDSVEVQHGRSNGKVREKFTSTKQMLDLVCCA